MEYFKFFEHHNDYDNYINDIKAITPNVSYCQDLNDIHYTKFEYRRLYLTITALEPGEFIFGYYEGTETENNLNVSYSTDNGETWTTIDNDGTEQTETIDVEEGDKILLKGDNVNLYSRGHVSSSIIIRSNFNCEVSGNIMSLLYEDNFLNNIELPESNTFYQLFAKVESATENLAEYLINAENLILPATTLTYCCYTSMFMDCINLTTAPELPATTLASMCYNSMFQGCTSLTTAPELPATTLASSCYANMFSGCTSLNKAPELLPATTLTLNYYLLMFSGCTSLTSAPELPATTLANYCYRGMFFNCTNLTKVPELLPATTLTTGCYYLMFYSCKNITTAPELPATTLVNSCYINMFDYCSKLNYIKAMFTTAPSSTYTQNWVNGVASTGTFVKNSAASWTTTGINSVPTGWTVETASA